MKHLLLFLVISFSVFLSSADEEVVTAGQVNNNLATFAIDFYKSSLDSSNSANWVVSPLSVALGLVLLLEGATDNTKKMLMNILASSNPNVDVLSHYQQLLSQLKIDTDKLKLSMASGLFIDQQFTVNPKYQSTMTGKYQCRIESVDFDGNLEQTLQSINSWVSERTMGKIPQLFQSGDLSKDIQLVLANAVYFKASWQKPFKLLDEKKKFQNFDKQEEEVEYISGSGLCLENENLKTIQIPYQGEIFSMLIFLPTEMKTFEESLNGEKIGDLIGPFNIKDNEKIQPVTVELPKFDIRSSMNLQNSMKNLGLGDLFDKANLGGISETPLKISKALHQAFIQVNEYGTEAAAATATSVMYRSLFPFPTVTIDRPFVFSIVHKETGGIIFMGKVNSVGTSASDGTSTSQDTSAEEGTSISDGTTDSDGSNSQKSIKLPLENNMLTEAEGVAPAYTL